MGWTGCYKSSAESAADFLIRDWGLTPDDSRSIVASATVGNVVHLAMRYASQATAPHYYEPDEDGSVTVALVYLTNRRRGPENFYFKDMDETMGPFESVAPPSFIAKLSKLKPYVGDQSYSGHRSAIEWRARCLDRAAQRKAALRLKVGMEVELDEPVKFGSGYIRHFKVVELTRWSRGKNRQVLCFRNNTPGSQDSAYYQLRLRHRLLLRLSNPPVVAPPSKPVITVRRIGERVPGRFQLRRKMIE